MRTAGECCNGRGSSGAGDVGTVVDSNSSAGSKSLVRNDGGDGDDCNGASHSRGVRVRAVLGIGEDGCGEQEQERGEEVEDAHLESGIEADTLAGCIGDVRE